MFLFLENFPFIPISWTLTTFQLSQLNDTQNACYRICGSEEMVAHIAKDQNIPGCLAKQGQPMNSDEDIVFIVGNWL